MISTLLTKYKKTNQFAELNLFAEQPKLLATSPIKTIQTPVRNIFTYKKILNKFVI